ncbi:MAG: hypothetical protein JWN12_175 [Candidatus Saccharibacteria bacterium]|nr:hypothetical protein [Candidatus Saccharibacteria bacterium]
MRRLVCHNPAVPPNGAEAFGLPTMAPPAWDKIGYALSELVLGGDR